MMQVVHNPCVWVTSQLLATNQVQKCVTYLPVNTVLFYLCTHIIIPAATYAIPIIPNTTPKMMNIIAQVKQHRVPPLEERIILAVG